jgi:hypothetical protein
MANLRRNLRTKLKVIPLERVGTSMSRAGKE